MSKNYTQCIERNNLSLRQHLAKLPLKILSCPTFMEMYRR
ncbi:IS1 family transposase [Xenorhabdus sp. KJ12.1]